MGRLNKGEKAPDFLVSDIDGTEHKLNNFEGKYLLLSFYRYASCPFCNLRISQLMKRVDEFEKEGLELLAVFQSPEEKIKQYVMKQKPPFPIVADPERKLYSLYRLETSWLGLMKTMVFKVTDMMKAFSKGFLPGTIEGEMNRLPADFLINKDGIIVESYYGKDIGDHMAFETIERHIKEAG